MEQTTQQINEKLSIPIKTKIVAWLMTVIGAIGLIFSLLILSAIPFSNPADDLGLFLYISVPLAIFFFPGVMLLFKKGLGWWFSVFILIFFIIFSLFAQVNDFIHTMNDCNTGAYDKGYLLDYKEKVCSTGSYLLYNWHFFIRCIIYLIPLIIFLIDRKNFWVIASQPKWWWYILFGLIGGIIGYVKIRDTDKKIAKRVVIGGILFNISIILIVILVGVYVFRWDISFISDPAKNFIYKDRYTTYSDGIVIEYPARWYKKIHRTDILSLWIYPTSNPYKTVDMEVGVWDETRIFNRSGIYDTSSAIEHYLEGMKTLRPGFELSMKDLKENVGRAEFKYTSDINDNVYFVYYKIIKCGEKLYKLTLHAEESNNLKYSADINRIINSFRCK